MPCVPRFHTTSEVVHTRRTARRTREATSEAPKRVDFAVDLVCDDEFEECGNEGAWEPPNPDESGDPLSTCRCRLYAR